MPNGRKSLEPWIRDEIEYYPYQIEGIRHLARMRSWLCADDMGLGKTLTALTVFAIDVAQGRGSKAVVIAPVSLKYNWADEIEKFTSFHCTVLEGTPAQRREQLKEFSLVTGPKLLVVNYEQVKVHLPDLNLLRFDVSIFDEAHFLKNPKAQRTKACLSLRTKRSFMLTGTPMLNRVDELWSILHRIKPTEYPKYWTFTNRYAAFGGWQNKQIVGIKNERELESRLAEVMLRRLKKDVLDLPDVQYIERRVELLPEQRKLYNTVMEDMELPRADQATPDQIENALTRFLRLKQICGSTLEFTGEDHSAKLDLALEDDEELFANGHRVIQFTQFRSVQAAYIERVKKLDVPVFVLNGDVDKRERSNIVKEWAATEQPGVIVCMLQVAGIGLNMTASRHVSFLDELFVPGLNQQAVDRAYRIGADKTQPVTVRKYICRNTIESRVQAILRTKTKLISALVESDPDWKKKLYAALQEDAE